MRFKKGIFITFEGIEGSGKSTQLELLCDYVASRGIDYVRTVEPGGTMIGEEIRKILLSVEHSGMTSLTELLLYASSRAQHVGEVIKPALKGGRVVVCDRFSDSTIAYQGFGRGLDMDLIAQLNAMCTDGIIPDITFLLDIDVETGLKRNRTANKIDRLELEAVAFHTKVRDGYLSLMEKEPGRIRLIDSNKSVEEISDSVAGEFRDYMEKKGNVV
jgi:dTMP kinase